MNGRVVDDLRVRLRLDAFGHRRRHLLRFFCFCCLLSCFRSSIADVLVYVEAALKQTMGIVLCSTFLISFLFLPWERPAIVFWISSSFMAINALVFGFLSYGTVFLASLFFWRVRGNHFGVRTKRRPSFHRNAKEDDEASRAIKSPFLRSHCGKGWEV